MAMKPQRLFYRAIQLPSAQWHWQIEYQDGEVVFQSIQGYTRRFDAKLGCDRIWGRPLFYRDVEAKPPAPSKSPEEFRAHLRGRRLRKGDTVTGATSGVKMKVAAVTRSGAKAKKKVKRRRSR